MTKLEKLYQTIQNLKELGYRLDEKMLNDLDNLEAALIETEVLPALANAISPTLNQLQRALTLEVIYVPDEPLSVRLMRGEENEGAAFGEPEDSNEENPARTRRTFTMSPHTKGRRTALKVHFPDGTVIREYYAARTLVEVIRKVGPERIQPLGLAANGVPLVSRERDEFYKQHDLGDGTLVMTHTSTRVKKDLLDEVSNALGLGLEVEIV